MFIRAQFTGQAFKNLLRFRACSMARPCPQLYFPNAGVLISRIDFVDIGDLFVGPTVGGGYPNNGPLESSFLRSRLGVKLKFHVVAQQLDAANDPQFYADKEGYVDVAVGLVVQGGTDYLRLEVLGTDFDAVLSLVGAGQLSMSDLLGAGDVELGLLKQVNELVSSVGKFLHLKHVDFGFDIETDRVELRAELVVDGLPSSGYEGWKSFYGNSLDSLTGGNEWALEVDQRLGSELLTRIATASIDNSGGFERDGPVKVYWNAAAPGYHMSVEGELIDACQCAWGEIDLDIRAWADASLSLTGSTLRVDVRVDHKITDYAEAACCGITTVALFPILGLKLAIAGEIDWTEYLIGFALYPYPVLLLIAVLAKLDAKLSKGLPLDICTTDPADDKHAFCEFTLPVLSESASCQGLQLTVVPATLSGTVAGLLIGGRINLPQIVDPDIQVEATPFAYKPPYYGCSGGGNRPDGFEATLRVFRASGNYDFRVCSVQVLGDFKMAAKVTIESMTCPYTAWITVRLGVNQYNYTPVKLLVSTTHGVLHAVIAPPAKRVSEEERADAAMKAQVERVSRCYAKSKRWDIRWLVDPPPFVPVAQTRRIWTLTGVAAAEAGRVEVVNEAGTRLATLDPGAGRAFRLPLMDPGSGLSVIQESGLAVERLESADLRIAQTLAIVDREIGFETPVIAFDVVRASPARWLVVHEREQVTVFDVTEQGNLRLQRSLDTRDAEWVGRRDRTLYAMSRASGLRHFELEGGRGWRADARPAGRPHRECGCGGVEEPTDPEGRSMTRPAGDAHGFEHLVEKHRVDAGPRVVRIQAGFRVEQSGDLMITSLVDRPAKPGAVVRVEMPAAASVARLRAGALLVPGRRPEVLELLRALSRQEL